MLQHLENKTSQVINLTRFVFHVRQKFESMPREQKSFLNSLDNQQRCNKYLTNLVYFVRTVSYGCLRFKARALRVQVINRMKKRLGPKLTVRTEKTILLRGINICRIYPVDKSLPDHVVSERTSRLQHRDYLRRQIQRSKTLPRFSYETRINELPQFKLRIVDLTIPRTLILGGLYIIVISIHDIIIYTGL